MQLAARHDVGKMASEKPLQRLRRATRELDQAIESLRKKTKP
jgi:hypothetical protein